jgi:hypothetical protein
MRNIINKYHVGEIFNGKTSEDLATQIQRLITDKTQLNKYHNNCITAAAELTWENEEQILLKIFKDL